MKMRKKKFLRRTWNRFIKLGKGRKKKQKWRKPKGRHNKMRERREGYPATVEIGYKRSSIERGKIPVKIENLNDIKKTNRGELVIFGKIGKRKKIEMCKEAERLGLKVLNINVKKFLRKIEIEKKKIDKGETRK